MAGGVQQNWAIDSDRPAPRRVMIIDDSAVARQILERIVNGTGKFETVAKAYCAKDALEQLADTSVDFILLDIEMPGMSGVDAMPLLREASDNAPILILSSHCAEGAGPSLRAMTLGASDVLLKPGARSFGGQFAVTLEAAMTRIADDLETQPRPLLRNAAVLTDILARPVKCVAIGASTGGLHALNGFFSALPRDIAMPILVTQHLPRDFIGYFATQLEFLTGRPVCVAQHGQRVGPAMVLVAPGDMHLTVAQRDADIRVVLLPKTDPSGACPSVDSMLASVAEVYRADAVGVVLSGMGRDGAIGARALADRGGRLLVQDRESSVIWGMPGAVADQGIAHLIAPPAELARRIGTRARTFGWS